MFLYEYTHGGNIYDENGHINTDMIDFSANINPLGIPDEVISAAVRSLTQSNIYPDSYCRLLSLRLSEFEEIDRTHVFCSNGASDILFRLIYAVNPKKILVTAPSFADYGRAGKAAGAEIIYYPLKKENGFNIDNGITDVILSRSPDIVFVCNPNNPTGNLTGTDMMKEIAAACESVGSILLADECFLDFVRGANKYSAKSLLVRYKNIVILKAFTKIFAIPGLRLGYALCGDETLIDRMRFHGADWSVSNVAQTAGIATLENSREYIYKSVAYIDSEREKMMRKLAQIGLTVYPSYANFIFFHCPWNIDLYGELRKRNIIIRNCADFKGLEQGYYRTAVLTNEKNERLIKEVKGIKGVTESWQNQ